MSKGSMGRVFIILLLCICSRITAQDANTAVFQIVDKQDGQPIVFATVILINSRVGVISDENGNFRIPRRFLKQGESLRISCIGYGTRIFEVSKMLFQKKIILTLEQKLESLNEVVLKTGK